MELGFVNLLVVAAIALAAPLALGLTPGLRMPAVVAEIVLGIAVGPHGLGWVQIDTPVEVVSLLGLAFLLLLAGLELDVRRLRGLRLRLAAAGFAVSVAIAFVVGYALKLGGLADAPLLIAVALVATSLGVIVPVLKDAGEADRELGQLVIAAASIADFGAIVLLSILFSGEEGNAGT
ncbi:MAG TPA: cation:proton antiporter, partial [Solirubrobacteraceae bacterium]|nr:cation:proton antiporter [Solirubrobacteraceae bacterium]